MNPEEFNANQSKLERDPEKIKTIINDLEKEIGHNFKIVCIIEMGSFAKGEAIPGSDNDLRIYVSSPNFYLWQMSMSNFNDSKKEELEKTFLDFIKEHGEKSRLTLDWFEFNNPIAKNISEKYGINIEFGLSDIRFAEYELRRLEHAETTEHQLITQSNIIYDPTKFINKIKNNTNGIIFPKLSSFYQERYLDKLPFEIYLHLEPHKMDVHKIERDQQIQWVKWAVRSIRDSIYSKQYINNGALIYRKNEILEFCNNYLDNNSNKIIKEIYSWKTDVNIRKEMVNNFIKYPNKCFTLFKEYTKKLEEIVKIIDNLEL